MVSLIAGLILTRMLDGCQMAKETIKPPTKKELTDASKQLKKGHSSAGRTMADKSVAVRQGVVKGKGGKK
jgi:hypothetical protein